MDLFTCLVVFHALRLYKPRRSRYSYSPIPPLKKPPTKSLPPPSHPNLQSCPPSSTPLSLPTKVPSTTRHTVSLPPFPSFPFVSVTLASLSSLFSVTLLEFFPLSSRPLRIASFKLRCVASLVLHDLFAFHVLSRKMWLLINQPIYLLCRSPTGSRQGRGQGYPCPRVCMHIILRFR